MNTNAVHVITRMLLLFILLGTVSIDAQAQKSKKKTKKAHIQTAQPQNTETKLEERKTPEIDKPDINIKPLPLGSTAFTFPDFEEFTMPNGLHVFIVENHQLPTITFSVLIKGGDAYDPAQKEGTAAITCDLLTKGTTKHSAAEIAEMLDGVGASLSVSTAGEATTISGASLKKHSNLLFSVLGEQIIMPLFDESELEKLRKQYLASVANNKSRSIEVAQALSRKVIYGFENPLARIQTEKSINNIKKADITAFFNSFIKPNNASIAIVGDVTVKEVKALLTKHLDSWTKGQIPSVDFPDIKPEKQGVYFVARPGAVQSTIIVCSPAPSSKDEKFIAADMAATYMGGGFGSVLFSTLREKHSYTYSPFAFVTSGPRYNRFALGSEVRSSVTDSATTVILRELQRLINEGPDEENLKRSVAYEVGSYKLSFERASNVATYLQNGWYEGTSMDEVKRKIDRMEAVTYGDVSEVARKYLGMFDLRIVVVGNPDVRTVLEKFGPVYDYSLDLTPIVAEVYQPVNMTVDEIVKNYTKAIGGEEAVSAIYSVVMNGKASMMMQGREMSGTIIRKWKKPGMEYVNLNLNVMRQIQITDGTNAWVSLNGGPLSESDREETQRVVLEARVFPVLSWKTDGYATSVKGKKGEFIVVEAIAPDGKTQQYFFNERTMLLSKSEKIEETPQGPVTVIEKYNNYVDISGVKFPTDIINQNSIYSISFTWDIQVNTPIDDKEFSPQEGH